MLGGDERVQKGGGFVEGREPGEIPCAGVGRQWVEWCGGITTCIYVKLLNAERLKQCALARDEEVLSGRKKRTYGMAVRRSLTVKSGMGTSAWFMVVIPDMELACLVYGLWERRRGNGGAATL